MRLVWAEREVYMVLVGRLKEKRPTDRPKPKTGRYYITGPGGKSCKLKGFNSE